MAYMGLTIADNTWAPICWEGSADTFKQVLGIEDTCAAVLNSHGTDEYNWRKGETDDHNSLAPTMETLSCDLKGPNADMNKFWQERHNSEWTEVGKGEADKFAEKWGSSRQRVESCLNELKTNPDDKTCLEGIDMVATFGHCLKKPEKQVCGECGLMKIRNNQPLVLTSTAQFPAPEKDFHILVMCLDAFSGHLILKSVLPACGK